MNIFKFFITLILIALVPSMGFSEELTIGKLHTNRFLSCNYEDKKLKYFIKIYNGTELTKTKRVRKKKVRNIRLRNISKLLDLLVQKKENRTNQKVIGKIEDKLDRSRKFVSNIRSCNRLKKLSNDTEDTPIDENEKFDLPSDLEGGITGSCILYGQKITAYNDEARSPILAPLSGSLKCTLSKIATSDIVVKIISKEDNTEIVGKKIVADELKNSRIFNIPLCTDFPGCYVANKVTEAIEGVGIEVRITSDGSTTGGANINNRNKKESKATFRKTKEL